MKVGNSSSMEGIQVGCEFFFEELELENRKKLFEEALKNAMNGKVLYIMCNELEELPKLSQEQCSMRQYMKMISFLYANSLESLIESLSTLPNWQSIPSTIILDDLSAYCNKNSLHAACGVVALLVDSARSCAEVLGITCKLCISTTKGVVDEEYCNALKELYFHC